MKAAPPGYDGRHAGEGGAVAEPRCWAPVFPQERGANVMNMANSPWSSDRLPSTMDPMRDLDIDVRTLPEQVSPPDHWQELSACYGLDPEVFFPTTEAFPRMICSAPTWMAFVPDPQAMFTVNAGLSSPRPLRYATCRAEFGPLPACLAWPNTSSSISEGATSARDKAAFTAWIPRSTAGTSENAPRNLPTGVRAPSTMTARSTRTIVRPNPDGTPCEPRRRG